MKTATLIQTLCAAALLSASSYVPSHAFSPLFPTVTQKRGRQHVCLLAASSEKVEAAPTTSTTAPPVLNGKRVLPYKVIMGGLKGHKVAAVYAVLDSSFQRGSEGWNKCTYVGVAQDLEATIRTLHEQDATELKVAHVRALSFSFPQPNAMQEVASQWRKQAMDAGANLEEKWASDALDYLFDDDDDDEIDYDMEMAADAMAAVSSSGDYIISPFAESDGSAATGVPSSSESPLEFTAANVDKVLDEVRPYLIADGGNVSVERVDEEGKKVYLKLEGACGSCASSTVTMQMGIERVLKENFPDLNGVLQIEDDADSRPKQLTMEAVEAELNRLRPALIAMGGVVEVLGIDDTTGVVDIRFRGANKVRQGLELAILDVPFVHKVNFVMGEDD